MQHRIFLALPISETLQTAILAWEQKFQQLPVRWLKGRNLHITLIPPWYEDGVEKIIAKLNTLTKSPLDRGAERSEAGCVPAGNNIEMGLIKPFDLSFHAVSFGPNPRAPRLIWAEGTTPPQLLQLKSNLEQIFDQTSQRTSAFSPRKSASGRPFRLHLTLARFRPEHFRSFPIKTLSEAIDWRDTVNSFALMESHLHPTGAEYEVLATYLLTHLTPTPPILPIPPTPPIPPAFPHL